MDEYKQKKEDLYSLFEYKIWKRTPTFLKKRILKELSALMAQEMGIQNIPKIVFSKNMIGTVAVFYGEANIIVVDERRICHGDIFLNEAGLKAKDRVYNLEAIDGIVHEMMHAYQYEQVSECDEEVFNVKKRLVQINNGEKSMMACSYIKQGTGANFSGFLYVLQKAERKASEAAGKEVEIAESIIRSKYPSESTDENFRMYKKNKDYSIDEKIMKEEYFSDKADVDIYEEFDKAYRQLFFKTNEGANERLIKLIADAAVATYEKYMKREPEIEKSQTPAEKENEDVRPAKPRKPHIDIEKRLGEIDSKRKSEKSTPIKTKSDIDER